FHPPVAPGFADRFTSELQCGAQPDLRGIWRRQHAQVKTPGIVVRVVANVAPHELAAVYAAVDLQFTMLRQCVEQAAGKIDDEFDGAVAAQAFAVARGDDARQCRRWIFTEENIVIVGEYFAWR